MEFEKKFSEILKKNTYSIINTYFIIGEINTGKSKYLKSMEEIQYFDFEEEAENFFKKFSVSIDSFRLSMFYERIKELVTEEKILVVDNMEIIENILYSKDKSSLFLKNFFKDSINYKFKNKVVFVLSDIRKMRIEKCLKEVKFPEKNILNWR